MKLTQKTTLAHLRANQEQKDLTVTCMYDDSCDTCSLSDVIDGVDSEEFHECELGETDNGIIQYTVYFADSENTVILVQFENERMTTETESEEG